MPIYPLLLPESGQEAAFPSYVEPVAWLQGKFFVVHFIAASRSVFVATGAQINAAIPVGKPNHQYSTHVKSVLQRSSHAPESSRTR